MGFHGGAVLMVMSAAVVLGFCGFPGAQSQVPDCAQKLIPCADYLNSTKPPASCCNPIKEAVNTQLACLCNLYTNPELLKSLGVNLSDALHLSQACGVPVDVNRCSSPPPAAPPPAAGKDNGNSADRIPLTGVKFLLLLWAAVMVFI